MTLTVMQPFSNAGAFFKAPLLVLSLPQRLRVLRVSAAQAQTTAAATEAKEEYYEVRLGRQMAPVHVVAIVHPCTAALMPPSAVVCGKSGDL